MKLIKLSSCDLINNATKPSMRVRKERVKGEDDYRDASASKKTVWQARETLRVMLMVQKRRRLQFTTK